MPPARGRSTGGTTNLPTFGSTEWVAETCCRAEAAGAGAVWATDHLFWRRPATECLTTLAAAAGPTRRATLGTCVLQLPLRSPAAVAKQVAALQALSGGRVILGVGAGSHRAEYELAGADFAARGRALEEGVGTLRRLWANAGTSPGYRMAPAREAPVWIGGSSAAARRRAARLGDGWIPLFVDPDRFAHEVRALRDDAEAAGRDPASVVAAVVMVASVATSPAAAAAAGLPWLADLYGIPARAFERHLVAGSGGACAEAAAAYLDAGAQHVAVMVAGDDAPDAFAAIAASLCAGAPARPAPALAGALP
jgi:alkanesulfonate monooxygenase SsuD/methylene tetrahydromethanopterin reductase-like flavin-dependent oxidoreductase (luciferase family)